MAAAEPKENKTVEAGTQATEPHATSSEEKPQESLEDLLRTLSHNIKSTGWLKENTAEKWMAENPETAKEVQRVIAEQKASSQQKKDGGDQGGS